MADIVEKLRWAATMAHNGDLEESADEIERPRGENQRLRGGWTRLGPDSLPPQDGTLFEIRFDGEPTRIIAAVYDNEVAFLLVASGCRPGAGQNYAPERWLRQAPGWWRLLPGGEPPT